MILNPPLLLVSALFYLALASALSVGAWLAATLILRARRVSHAGAKRVLLAALILPPTLAAIPTLGGATLRHSHALVSEHHSMACQDMFAALGRAGTGGPLAGWIVNGAAWAILAVGVLLFVRLARATWRLEDGLTAFLSPPSPKLAASLARVGARWPGLPSARFFECAFPAAYSSVFGLRRVRCALSREIVAAASDDELDAVVAHEAGHLRAGDAHVALLVGAIRCLFFPIRPVRLLARRWREEAELAADEAAVAATRQPLAMARAILRASGASVPLPAVALPFADDTACAPEKRVERLLASARAAAADPNHVETRRQVWLGWLATLALAAVGALLLLSAGMVCYAHCSLETVAHFLP